MAGKKKLNVNTEMYKKMYRFIDDVLPITYW